MGASHKHLCCSLLLCTHFSFLQFVTSMIPSSLLYQGFFTWSLLAAQSVKALVYSEGSFRNYSEVLKFPQQGYFQPWFQSPLICWISYFWLQAVHRKRGGSRGRACSSSALRSSLEVQKPFLQVSSGISHKSLYADQEDDLPAFCSKMLVKWMEVSLSTTPTGTLLHDLRLVYSTVIQQTNTLIGQFRVI